MIAKAFIAVSLSGLPHHRVDGGDHRHRIATGVIAAEQVATQTFNDKFLRRQKHLRFCPAKAVNALLRVADQKHTGRTA